MGQFAHWRINLVTSGCFNGIITINTVDALVSWQNYRLLPLLQPLFGEEEPPICTPCWYCSTTRYRFFLWGPTFFIPEKRTIFNNSSGWLQLISLFGSKSGDGHRKQCEDWYISNCPYNFQVQMAIQPVRDHDAQCGWSLSLTHRMGSSLRWKINHSSCVWKLANNIKKPFFSHHLQSGQPILRKYCKWLYETLPNAQRTRESISTYQSNLMGHITSSNTNLDQIWTSESRLRINFSTKH